MLMLYYTHNALTIRNGKYLHHQVNPCHQSCLCLTHHHHYCHCHHPLHHHHPHLHLLPHQNAKTQKKLSQLPNVNCHSPTIKCYTSSSILQAMHTYLQLLNPPFVLFS